MYRMVMIAMLAVALISVSFLPALAGEKEAVEFLTKLYGLPDNPLALSKVQNEALKEEAARTLILEYALRKAHGFPQGSVSGKTDRAMVRGALEELNAFSGAFADRGLGNGDGVVSADEMNKLSEATRTNPGLRAFARMYWEYSR